MLKSRVRALLVRPCSNVAFLCNHDNKELKEDVDGCVEVGGSRSWYMICSAAIYVHVSSDFRVGELDVRLGQRYNAVQQVSHDSWNVAYGTKLS